MSLQILDDLVHGLARGRRKPALALEPPRRLSPADVTFSLMDPKERFFLFVYGSLCRGGEGADLLSDCEYVREASLRGTLYDLGDYPALTLDGTSLVHGELCRCPPETLPALDSYEGVSEGLFSRVAVEFPESPAWTYVAGPALVP
jgi:gamma-glutamylcyclotransferase (GGCT)/AIG2-like uncharacterized protein YtfP